MILNIDISKKNGVWVATLYQQSEVKKGISFPAKDQSPVKAESFGELMIRIGEKNWVDLVNKNGND